jgi:pimeloyl-ACP methyl ester carboxylesterase
MRHPAVVALVSLFACSNPPVPVTTGYVTVQGARLYYEEAGSGMPVVLIHGGFLDSRMWDDQFQTFARWYRTIRYDVRAHGQSRADSVGFTDHEDLHDLMDTLNVERAVIVGLSMGGQIAIDFALAYPERVAGLVLVGPGMSGFAFESDELQEYIEELTAAFTSNEFSEITATFARWWCDGPQRDSTQVDPLVRHKVLEMLSGSRQRWEYANLAEYLDPPAIEWLRQIRAPTMAIVGGIDMPDIHSIVDLIAEQVPEAQKVVIPNVAHMVNLEAPKEFNEIVLEFLKSIERG